jgi:hypothetical protein
MLTTMPPPIPMDQVFRQLAQLPSLPMHSFWELWDEYFETRPRRRSRNWLGTCLAHKIQEVAYAEYKMELSVTRKLDRAARTRAQRQRQRGDRGWDVPQDEVKTGTMVALPFGINAQIDSYLTLCPDLTLLEAIWLVCRVPYPGVTADGLCSPSCTVGRERSHRPTALAQAD